MLRSERQAKILQIIRERGTIENDDLARVLDVTPATIRRDLKTLSEQNLVRLEHGGASIADLLSGVVEPLYETKVFVNLDRKRLIGAAAAALVCDGDTVILDSGTTNAQVAESLRSMRLHGVTVVTPDLIVAKELCVEPHLTVVTLGGTVRRGFYYTYGPYAVETLKNIRANKVFLGIDAASKEHGISSILLDDAPVKQLLIQNSDRVIMVADSAKFGRNAPYKVSSWDGIHQVITDDGISQEYLEFFEAHGIQVQLVHPE
jgi:DeoR family transcriptional regulator, aga operon transcriptional repressor